ncbi:MAG: glutamyl-tRNA reductase [Planctomycetota bacterium]|nr:glutamyl-tRNA reductase [Planctomycetota bacterium]
MDGVTELCLVGLSHRTAAVDVRERYAIRPEDLPGCLAELAAADSIDEVVALSTCNRTEVLASSSGSDPLPELKRRLFRNLDDEHLYVYRGLQAILHLLRVTAGLDSLVLGEGEIQAQIKRAFEAARDAGTLGKALEPLGRCALEAGKRVRNETELGQGTLSVARVAVDVAHHAFGDFKDNHALVVGAGETGLLVARHLRDSGIAGLDFANRTLSRAEDAAREFGGQAWGLEQLAEASDRADILVVCVDGAPGLIAHETLDPRKLKRRDQPLLIIDLSVPRAVDPTLSELKGTLVYDLDDLQPVVERNRDARGDASRAASDILVAEVHKFLALRTYASFSPAIATLHTRFEGLREEVLDRVTGGQATPRELELAHELGRRLLDLALEQMKEGARHSRSAEALSREYERFLEDR